MSGPGARQSRNLVPGQRVGSLALMCLAISCATDRDGGRSQEADLAGMTIVYASDGQEHLPLIERYLVDGRQRVEDFFGSPFRRPFIVRIFPDRATLTEHWRLEWNLPDFESACWMVASGDVNLDLLSPTVWETEACEHDPSNELEVQRLITHELVHVYHTQVHPSFDAEKLAGIGWMVEGVATYASGQVDSVRMARASEAIELGEVPKQLADVWSGPYRYAVSGTLVAYIDEVFGRDVLNHLMMMSTEVEILDALGMSETELFASWGQHLLRGSG